MSPRGSEGKSGSRAIVGAGRRRVAQNGAHAVVEAFRAEAPLQSGDGCLDAAAERLVVEHSREFDRADVLHLRQGGDLGLAAVCGHEDRQPGIHHLRHDADQQPRLWSRARDRVVGGPTAP
jgi:hypothetical protein